MIIATFILASASKRRQKLLAQIGADYKIRVADVEEYFDTTLPVEEAMIKVARKKAEAVAEDQDEKAVVLAADTMVFFDGMPMGKPQDRADAFRMLTVLSGAWHDVYTAFCIHTARKVVCRCVRTRVKFYELSEAEIESYIDTGEPMDKAGGYGIQERGALLVERIEGDYFNVVGLPMGELERTLREEFDLSLTEED